MIDNTLRTAKIKMFFVIVFILFVFSLGYAFAGDVDNITKILLLIFSFLALSGYIIMHILKLHYFHLKTDRKNITVRFYNSHPFLRNYKQYQIPLGAFAGYKIQKSFSGLKQEIILKINTKKGIVEYPAISISALIEKERTLLYNLLKKLNK